MKLTKSVRNTGLNYAFSYLERDPDENIVKLLDWSDKFFLHKEFEIQKKIIRNILEDKESNWNIYLQSLWTDINPEIRKTFFQNFIINAGLDGWKKQEMLRNEHNCNIPWTILLDPTSSCNLNCLGCWASEYGEKLNLSYETINEIIIQGKELGVFVYIYTGGEPLVRKNDLIRLCEEHADCIFVAFTNGTLIDEAFANEILRVKNFIPSISVEGFQQATDSRRGDGTYVKVVNAMSILKKHEIPFGISNCYTRYNVDEIGSEEYFDQMVNWGAKFSWFFTYMPIGNEAVPDLMATAEQRKFMYNQIRNFRKTKSLFTIDFWNDGEYVGGCIAGGRRYLHINSNGDIEPCVFAHYSDSSIYKKSLLQAFKSPLFMQYYRNQPFNENHLRPCPILDNKGKLTELVNLTDAKSTDLQSPENPEDYCNRCNSTANDWEPIAEELWANSKNK